MKNKQEVIAYINALTGYEGYVQFSHRPIEEGKDIFMMGDEIAVEDEVGFVYEAHFANKDASITIRQINGSWLVSKTDIANINDDDIKVYFAKVSNVKMAQVWEEEADMFCEGMKVKKITKVVFAGFVKGEER